MMPCLHHSGGSLPRPHYCSGDSDTTAVQAWYHASATLAGILESIHTVGSTTVTDISVDFNHHKRMLSPLWRDQLLVAHTWANSARCLSAFAIGKVNSECQNPGWRHTMPKQIRFSRTREECSFMPWDFRNPHYKTLELLVVHRK